MRPLRLFLAVLLIVSLLVAGAFGVAVYQILTRSGDTAPIDSVFLAGFALFVLLLIPQAALYAWSNTHARSLDSISRLLRRELQHDLRATIPTELLEGEIGDLGRSVEELRRALVWEHDQAEMRRAVLTRILDALGEGVLAIDSEKRVVLANPRARHLLGIPYEPTGRESFLQFVRNARLAEALERAGMGQASASEIELTVAGEVRQLQVRVFPVEGQDITAAALLLDVTDLARLQTIRRDFLDDFSHEVRTPLAGLRSAVESLGRGDLRPDQELHLREIVLRQITRLENLIRNISELNEIESGASSLRLERVDLRELLSELIEEFADRLDDPEAIHLTGSSLVVTADALKLQQIFSNLLENAIRHSGTERIDVELAAEPGWAVVRVRDYGEGIPPEDQERVFHRFYRVDRSRAAGSGSGLGLAITKHLVLRHRGRISVTSAPEQGATFEVRLPAD